MIYSKQLPSGFREMFGILSEPTLFVSQCAHQIIRSLSNIIIQLALKAPITTAADDKLCDIFPNFRKKEGMIFHENRLPAQDCGEIS